MSFRHALTATDSIAARTPDPQSLDDFLLHELDLHPDLVVKAVRAIAARTGRSGPTLTTYDIATYLHAHGAPAFGERLLVALGQTATPAPYLAPASGAGPSQRCALSARSDRRCTGSYASRCWTAGNTPPCWMARPWVSRSSLTRATKPTSRSASSARPIRGRRAYARRKRRTASTRRCSRSPGARPSFEKIEVTWASTVFTAR